MTLLEAIGWAVTVIAVTGVVLNNLRNRACFVLWMVSNAMTAAVHGQAGMSGLLARDVIFFGLCIHGLWAWKKNQNRETEFSHDKGPNIKTR